MNCQRCNSTRLVDMLAKSLDPKATEVYIEDTDKDFIEYAVCLDCGQIQEQFPLPPGGWGQFT